MAIEQDVALLELAMAEAEQARGQTRPNPLVGAVVVDEARGEILARAHHQRAGADHAEVAALAPLGERARGKTLIVTLEPCNHIGRTGKCTDAILEAGIRRVVCGMRDPNPHVAGGGIARLREAGVEVTMAPLALQRKCQRQILGYLRGVLRGEPHVIMKAAVSLDGRIAPAAHAGPYWLTCPEAIRRAHQLRQTCDAILVGAGTVLADDPELTVRLPDQPPGALAPLRVVLDGALRTLPSARLCGPGTLLVTSAPAAAAQGEKVAALQERGVELEILPPESAATTDVPLTAVLAALTRRGLQTVLCEGGGTLHGRLLRGGHYGEAALFVAPLFLGDGAVPLLRDYAPEGFAGAPWLLESRITVHGRDALIEGLLPPAQELLSCLPG